MLNNLLDNYFSPTDVSSKCILNIDKISFFLSSFYFVFFLNVSYSGIWRIGEKLPKEKGVLYQENITIVKI